MATILWDYNSAYYSWGILASGGGYVFGANHNQYDAKNVGVADSGAVEGLSQIIALIQAGILPGFITYSSVERIQALRCPVMAEMAQSRFKRTENPEQLKA